MGEGIVILGIAIFVVVAWWLLARRNSSQSQAEVDDEPWAESLTDEDVQDIYGDREERWKPDDKD